MGIQIVLSCTVLEDFEFQEKILCTGDFEFDGKIPCTGDFGFGNKIILNLVLHLKREILVLCTEDFDFDQTFSDFF